MFKKTLGLWMAFMMIFSLAACGQAAPSSSESTPSNESATRSEAPESQATKTSEAETSSDDGKTLVVYFSCNVICHFLVWKYGGNGKSHCGADRRRSF